MSSISMINRQALEENAKIRAKLQRAQDSRDAGVPVSLRFDHGRHAHLHYTATPCLEVEGRWRITRWDDIGPLGHTAGLDVDGATSELYVLGARA